MSIKSTTSLGFQCPHCGDIQQVEISIFDVSRFKSIEVKCQSCQKVFAKVKLANRECYEINALCIDCLDTHNYKIKRGELWLSKYRDFRCTQTNEPIFAIGKSEEVEKTILSMYDENEMMADGEFLDEEMLDSEMFEEFYEQLNQSPGFAQDGLARIMQEFNIALEHLNDLFDDGKITCKCGDDLLKMEITPEAIIIECVNCGKNIWFDISTFEDLEKVKNLTQIKIK